MSFKIDIEVRTRAAQNKMLTFVPREQGEVGKDITAVKMALGLIRVLNTDGVLVDSEEAPPLNTEIPLDKQSWFDCANGTGIDALKAATFDIQTRNALMKFQINNRFLIMCYLFERYAINDILAFGGERYTTTEEYEMYNLFVEQKYYDLAGLFDMEFGSLKEATLAILHGWRPGTILTNTNYMHPSSIFSEVSRVLHFIPQPMYFDLENGRFGTTISDLIEQNTILAANSQVIRREFEEFKTTASSNRNWVKLDASGDPDQGADFGFPFEYGVISFPVVSSGNSLLYKFARAVIDTPEIEDVAYLPKNIKNDRARKFFEPDPFSDPDPFLVGDNTIGYFYETPYFLREQGPLPQDTPSAIQDIEDRALLQILRFYNKPQVWNFLLYGKEKSELEREYFDFNQISESRHSAYWPRNDSILSDLSRFEHVDEFVNLKRNLDREEREILSLEYKKNPRPNYSFPPRGYDTAEQYREYIDGLIEQKRENVQTYKNLIQSFPVENKAQKYFVVTTENYLPSINEQIPGAAQSWRDLESTSVEPLVKFVEYRTPSLRPGQAYRALVHINKKKLDLIKYGHNLNFTPDQAISQEIVTDELGPDVCYDQNTEQTSRTYEEYKLHALKRRREIARDLKAMTLERANPANNPTGDNTGFINLGYAGPFDLNKAFSNIYGLNNVKDDREYTRKIIGGLIDGASDLMESMDWLNTDSEMLQNILNDDEFGPGADKTNADNFNKLEISLSDLKRCLNRAAVDLQKASSKLVSEGITLQRGSDFTGVTEVGFLNSLYNQALEYIFAAYPTLVEDFGYTDTGSTEELVQNGTLDGEDFWIAMEFTNVGKNLINKEFPGGPRVGKKIQKFRFGPYNENNKEVYWSDDLMSKPENIKALSKYDGLSRPRTINYLSNIKFLGGFGGRRTGFDDAKGSCEDLGIDAQKFASLYTIGHFTTGIRVQPPETDKTKEAYNDWKKRYFSDPAAAWATTSAKNWEASVDPENFEDGDKALKMLGKACTLEDLYIELMDQIDLATLICNYLECIGLPAVSLKLPSFYLPPLPRMKVIGWYEGLVRWLINQWKQILTRFVCSLARTIIDKLAFPFCEEQLEDFIAAGSSASPLLNQALAEAFTKTGIVGLQAETEEERQQASRKAKTLFDDTAKVVTGKELCHLLEGRELDAAGMAMIRRLVEKNELSDDLGNSSAIANFFGVIGVYVPLEVCNQLSEVEVQLTSCTDAADPMRSIRNRLQNEDQTLSEQEIQSAIDLAEENLKKQKESIDALSDTGTMLDLVPDSLKPGPQHMINMFMPQQMENQLKLAIESIFMPVKMSYLTALNSYVPGLTITQPTAPKPGDFEYDDLSVIRLECSLERLKNFAMAVEKSKTNPLGKVVEGPRHPDLEHPNESGFLGLLSPGITSQADYDSLPTCITPYEVQELYTVFELEKVPTKRRLGDGRNFHYVHKRHYPTLIYGIFDSQANQNGQDELIQILDNKVITQSGGPALRQISQEEFREAVAPDPVVDNRDQSPINLPPSAPQDGLRGSRFYGSIVEGLGKGFAIQEGEFVLKPVQANIFYNLKPWKFPAIDACHKMFPPYPVNVKDDDGKVIDVKIRSHWKSGHDPVSLADATDLDKELPKQSVYPGIKMSKSVALKNPAIAMQHSAVHLAYNAVFDPVHAVEYPILPAMVAGGENLIPVPRSDDRVPYQFDSNVNAMMEPAYLPGGLVLRGPTGISPYFRRSFYLTKNLFYVPPGWNGAGRVFDLATKVSVDTLPKEYADEVIMAVEDLYMAKDGVSEMDSISHILPGQMMSWMTGAPYRTDEQGINYKWGHPIGKLPEYFHDFYAPNNPKLLTIANERVEYLSSVIMQELEKMQPTAREKYLPIVKGVFDKMSDKITFQYGNTKYSGVDDLSDLGADRQWDWKKQYPLDFMNINFRATPYNPSIKMVENATNNIHLDSYNIVIDTDQFLSQGINTDSDSGSGFMKHTETPLSLSQATQKHPTREIYKYCETIPNHIVENNSRNFVIEESNNKDFPRREAFAQFLLNAIIEDFNLESSDARVWNLHEITKTNGYKSAVETIMADLLQNIQFSSLGNSRYSQGLHRRISSKAYVVPGTKCLKNRFGLNEGSLMSFSDLLLKDAVEEIKNELKKPEYSLFNRDSRSEGPFENAVTKISYKMFVKVCILDAILKGGMAFSVWGTEPVIAHPLYFDYVFTHVSKELDKSPRFKSIWGPIAEEVSPGHNKAESLANYIKEEIGYIPQLARQIFNPGLGFKDFYNWHHHGRVVPRLNQVSNNLPEEGKTFYTTEGVFKRVPVPYLDNNKNYLTNYDQQALNLEKNTTRKSIKTRHRDGDGGGDYNKKHSTETYVNEFLIQDYVRIGGQILDPLVVDTSATAGGKYYSDDIFHKDAMTANARGMLEAHWRIFLINRVAYERIKPLSYFRRFAIESETFGWQNRGRYEQLHHRLDKEYDPNIDGLPPGIFTGIGPNRIIGDYANPDSFNGRYQLDSWNVMDDQNFNVPPEQIGEPGFGYLTRNSIPQYRPGLVEYSPLALIAGNIIIHAQIIEDLCRGFGMSLKWECPNGFTPFSGVSALGYSKLNRMLGAVSLEYPGLRPLTQFSIDEVVPNLYAEPPQSRDSAEGVISFIGPFREAVGQPEYDPVFDYYDPGNWHLEWGWNNTDRDADPNGQGDQRLNVLYHDLERFFDQRLPDEFVFGEGIVIGISEEQNLSDSRGNRIGTVVLNIREFDNMMARIRNHLDPDSEEWALLLENSTFYHGIRLVNAIMMDEKIYGISNESVTETYAYKMIKLIENLDPDSTASIKERAFITRVQEEGQNMYGVTIPLVSKERPLSTDNCPQAFNKNGLWDPQDEQFIDLMSTMESRLASTSEYTMLMDHIFPMRRYMTICTLSSTSALAGFNTLPTLFDSVKSYLGFVAFNSTNKNPFLNQSGPGGGGIMDQVGIDQAEFQNFIKKQGPSDPEDSACFEFPEMTEEFWREFFKELGELLKYFPSHLFRGIASQLDPMYKEMRAHYFNCDIPGLDWPSTWPMQSVQDTLVNGLNLHGSGHGERKGTYANILTTMPTDMILSLMSIFWRPKNMLRTVSKTVSYAFSGMLPFIDVSTIFKVPCIDVDKNWLKDAKYDFGKYGRYGHPISPFTILALSTFQIPADMDKRDANCPDETTPKSPEVSENECDNVDEQDSTVSVGASPAMTSIGTGGDSSGGSEEY